MRRIWEKTKINLAFLLQKPKKVTDKRNKIHAYTLLFSTIGVILPNLISSIPNWIVNILVSIACSCFASALISIFLDLNEQKYQYEELVKKRRSYFDSLHEELITFIQRLLWFDQKISDNTFDWSLPVETYSSFEYTLKNSPGYFSAERISFEDAKKLLYQRYSVDGIAKRSIEEQKKTHKMFLILSKSVDGLKEDLSSLQSNAISLSVEQIVSFDESMSLIRCISIAFELMSKKTVNYREIIRLMLSETEKVRKLCEFNNELSITPFPNQGYLSDISKLIQ